MHRRRLGINFDLIRFNLVNLIRHPGKVPGSGPNPVIQMRNLRGELCRGAMLKDYSEEDRRRIANLLEKTSTDRAMIREMEEQNPGKVLEILQMKVVNVESLGAGEIRMGEPQPFKYEEDGEEKTGTKAPLLGFSAKLAATFSEPLQKRKRTKKDPPLGPSMSSSSTVKIEDLIEKSEYDTLKEKYDSLKARVKGSNADIEISDSD